VSPKRKRKPEGRAGRPASPRERTGEPRRTWPPLAIVLAAATALHAAIFSEPFFADDYLFLDQVRARPLWDALTSRDPLGNFLRPVGRQLHFWVWSHATRESPLAFHVVNLLVFLAAVALLYEIARRLAGRGPALVAASFLAFHYAADVPLSWASGSQDLLALAFGLCAILLAMQEHVVAAAAAFGVAVLSKETAAAIPILCFVAGRRPSESPFQTLRRQWPIFAVLAAWALWWLATFASRHGAPEGVSSPGSLPAAFVHALQVALGLEWSKDNPLPLLAHPWIWIPLVAGALATWWAARDARPSRRIWIVGATLAVLGAAPVIAVASIWSAYFYLLAMAGVALLLGAWVGSRPAWATAVVLLLGLASANARLTDEFSTAHGPWTRLSHVNRFYLDRAMVRVARYVEQMKAQEPKIPPRSTIFFGNFPSFLGFQAGDGPLVRWAYRDSSVRSYYVSGFDREHVSRGPSYFFVIRNDSLVEIANHDALIQDLWYTRFISQDWARAREILEVALPLTTHPQLASYWLAWVRYAQGDTAAAFAMLRPFRMNPVFGPSSELGVVDQALLAHDTLDAVRILSMAIPRRPLDARLHARMSDILLARVDGGFLGGLEASLTTVLDPHDATAWRRLAVVQIDANGPYEAKRSMQHYFELTGSAGRSDPQAVAIEQLVEQALPGGELVQKAIRR